MQEIGNLDLSAMAIDGEYRERTSKLQAYHLHRLKTLLARSRDGGVRDTSTLSFRRSLASERSFVTR